MVKVTTASARETPDRVDDVPESQQDAPEIRPDVPGTADKPRTVLQDAPVDPSPVGDEDFVYVSMPDGSTRAIPRSVVQAQQAKDAAAFAGQTGVFTVASPEVDNEVYVHLANGDVERVKESTLSGPAGANNPHGFFERDGHVHDVIGVYPVETKLPEEK